MTAVKNKTESVDCCNEGKHLFDDSSKCHTGQALTWLTKTKRRIQALTCKFAILIRTVVLDSPVI